ncbi:MAG: hypothetical protein ACE5HR_07270 [bacterium]
MAVSRFYAVTSASIVLVILLLLVPVGTVSAYPYGPYQRTRIMTVVDSETNEEIYRVTMYVEYYDYVYTLEVKVTKVAVTLTFLHNPNECPYGYDGYGEVEFVELAIGREPWNSGASLRKYWGAYSLEGETLVYYGDTKTYQAYPNMFMPLKPGASEEGDIWKVLPSNPMTWRLIADGLHFYASIHISLGPAHIRDQWAMQYHHTDPAPLLYYHAAMA